MEDPLPNRKQKETISSPAIIVDGGKSYARVCAVSVFYLLISRKLDCEYSLGSARSGQNTLARTRHARNIRRSPSLACIPSSRANAVLRLLVSPSLKLETSRSLA